MRHRWQLLEASGIREYQQVDIYNINNGECFSTYAIKAARRRGTISPNGAAERQAMVGDLLIIAGYSAGTTEELPTWRPVIVPVDEHNQPQRPAVATEPIGAS